MKCMSFRASKTDGVFSGRYTLTDDKVRSFLRLQTILSLSYSVCAFSFHYSDFT